MRKAGKGQPVAALVKKFRIAARRRLVRSGVVQADDCTVGHQRQQRSGGTVQDQRARRRGQSGDMIASRRSQVFTKFSLAHFRTVL
jgi:hypothetical protein